MPLVFERPREPVPASALHRLRHRRRHGRVRRRRRALLLRDPARLSRRAGRAADVRRADRLSRAAHVRRRPAASACTDSAPPRTSSRRCARSQGRDVYAFTRAGDEQTQAFARELGAVWAGASEEAPPQALDAAIIFAPVGALVPLALAAVAPGGHGRVRRHPHVRHPRPSPTPRCGRSACCARSPTSRAPTAASSSRSRRTCRSPHASAPTRSRTPTRRSPTCAPGASPAPPCWFPDAKRARRLRAAVLSGFSPPAHIGFRPRQQAAGVSTSRRAAHPAAARQKVPRRARAALRRPAIGVCSMLGLVLALGTSACGGAGAPRPPTPQPPLRAVAPSARRACPSRLRRLLSDAPGGGAAARRRAGRGWRAVGRRARRRRRLGRERGPDRPLGRARCRAAAARAARCRRRSDRRAGLPVRRRGAGRHERRDLPRRRVGRAARRAASAGSLGHRRGDDLAYGIRRRRLHGLQAAAHDRRVHTGQPSACRRDDTPAAALRGRRGGRRPDPDRRRHVWGNRPAGDPLLRPRHAHSAPDRSSCPTRSRTPPARA